MGIQGAQKASDSMEAKRQKGETIDAVYAHGSMMLSLGQAQIPGLGNVNQINLLKQLDKKGKVRVVKNHMTSILNYFRWDG